MELKESIIGYLTEKYTPEAIIVYGSFADGSRNAHSDFDALVIGDVEKGHDATMFGDTPLDVFLYPTETFSGEYDPEEFVQVFDGEIVTDRNGTAAALKERVVRYIEGQPAKTEDERQTERDWCKKMLARTQRGDAEGFYRWHWLLFDSPEIYCDLRGQHYFGPKKLLRSMQGEDPQGFALYERALKELSHEALTDWIMYLIGIRQ